MRSSFQKLVLYLNPIDEWCTTVNYFFETLKDGLAPKNLTYDATLWLHLSRSRLSSPAEVFKTVDTKNFYFLLNRGCILSFAAFFMLTGIGCVVGFVGCWRMSGDHLVSKVDR